MLSPLNSNSLVGLVELALLLLPLDLPPLVKKEVTQSALHGVLGPVHTPAVSDTLSSSTNLDHRVGSCCMRSTQRVQMHWASSMHDADCDGKAGVYVMSHAYDPNARYIAKQQHIMKNHSGGLMVPRCGNDLVGRQHRYKIWTKTIVVCMLSWHQTPDGTQSWQAGKSSSAKNSSY